MPALQNMNDSLATLKDDCYFNVNEDILFSVSPLTIILVCVPHNNGHKHYVAFCA